MAGIEHCGWDGGLWGEGGESGGQGGRTRGGMEGWGGRCR